MAVLILTPEFEKELDDSWTDDPDSWDAAAVLMEDFQEHQDVPTKVPIKKMHGYPGFEIKTFQTAKDQGCDIRIIKFLDSNHRLSKYRILVGYHSERDVFYALSYVNRAGNYEQSPDWLGRLMDRYRQCDLPVHR